MTKHRHTGRIPFLMGDTWRDAYIAPDPAAMHWCFTPSAEGFERTVYELSSGGTLADKRRDLAEALSAWLYPRCGECPHTEAIHDPGKCGGLDAAGDKCDCGGFIERVLR